MGRAAIGRQPVIDACSQAAHARAAEIVDSADFGKRVAHRVVGTQVAGSSAIIEGAVRRVARWSHIAMMASDEGLVRPLPSSSADAFADVVVRQYTGIVARESLVGRFTDRQLRALPCWLQARDLVALRRQHRYLSNDTVKELLFRNPVDPVTAASNHRIMVRAIQLRYPDISESEATYIALRQKTDPLRVAKEMLEDRDKVRRETNNIPPSGALRIAVHRRRNPVAAAARAGRDGARLRDVDPTIAPSRAVKKAWNSPNQTRRQIEAARRAAQSED